MSGEINYTAFLGHDYSLSSTHISQPEYASDTLEEVCSTNGINPHKISSEGRKIKILELFFNGFKNLNTLRSVFSRDYWVTTTHLPITLVKPFSKSNEARRVWK